MEPDDPPRKHYGFKDRTFKRDNLPPSAVPPMPTVKELAIMAGHKAPPPAKPAPAAANRGKAGDPNDVYAVLDQNRAVEQSDGQDTVVIKKKISRRKRDYWLVLIMSNLAITGLVGMFGFNVMSAIFGLAGVIIITLGTTWIMWFLIDDY